MKRRVEKPDRHRKPGHDREQLLEILALHRQKLGKRLLPPVAVDRHDHLAHGDDPVDVEEHVFGPAQPDPLGTEADRGAGVGRRLGIRADGHAAGLVGPAHDRRESARHFRLDGVDAAEEHLAGAAVDGDDVAFGQFLVADEDLAVRLVEPDLAGTGDAGPPHTARDHRGVACHAAPRRQDSGRRMHAVDVLRASLEAHQNHLFAACGQLLGPVGRQHDFAGGRPGRCRKALRDDGLRRVRVERRMQKLVERDRVDPEQRLVTVDQPFLGHLDRHPQRRRGGALAVAGLQHVELALLHGEFEVLHVAVMRLELRANPVELREHLRHRLFHRRVIAAASLARRPCQRQRGADPGDDILALGIDQIFAVEAVLAGRGVAREGDAGGAVLAHVAEHHRLHIHRRAPACGNAVEPPVGRRACIHPAVEDGADGPPQLIVRVLRKRPLGLFLDDFLIGRDERFQIVAGKAGVVEHAAAKLQLLERVLEQPVIDLHHHVGIHLDEAAVAVIGEPFVVRARREPDHGGVVQPEIENRVHHSRHRGAGAGSHRHQKRVVRIREAGARLGLDPRHRRGHLAAELLGIAPAIVVIMGADLGRNREARRHRKADAAHFGEVGALAAEKIAHAAVALGSSGTETVDPLDRAVVHSPVILPVWRNRRPVAWPV